MNQCRESYLPRQLIFYQLGVLLALPSRRHVEVREGKGLHNDSLFRSQASLSGQESCQLTPRDTEFQNFRNLMVVKAIQEHVCFLDSVVILSIIKIHFVWNSPSFFQL